MENSQEPPDHNIKREVAQQAASLVDNNSAASEFEYDFKHGCRHGASEDKMDIIAGRRIILGTAAPRQEAINELDRELGYAEDRRPHRELYRKATDLALCDYWSQPDVAEYYMNEKLIQLILAIAAEEILEHRKYSKAGVYTLLAWELRQALDNFNGDFRRSKIVS